MINDTKRTSLEILDMAITLTHDREKLIHELNKTINSPIGVACCVEPKHKKENNIEDIKREYENKSDNQREELRSEKQKAVREMELSEQIKAKNKAIELLRWLYKEDISDET